MGRIISIIMIGVSGYFLFQNRYRAMNVLFRSTILRRIFVSSIMGLPGVKDRLMKLVFSTGPAETH
ncbi:hypothetical protein RRV45_15400 [Bacillus sp. DTU_2020_1000418_1_SI_GHA_SEK_038]|uniref:hypothetical protein n=1 Tax=Bacillus sp. DTU_2020_1000418_1_SI_GHA_SEK_038 TaxID=3077585 RepID=UPI0028E93EA8|nr:hypothetical protein [Bacillus sp. DTU_2020_1000418_1_SI_GHA_SEK_038]WNS74295.1 hypothetical protein RRV45_15400 [Bacillus sp. DTU_2020_1000418_1_SI_GHA_SEK_038]